MSSLQEKVQYEVEKRDRKAARSDQLKLRSRNRVIAHDAKRLERAERRGQKNFELAQEIQRWAKKNQLFIAARPLILGHVGFFKTYNLVLRANGISIMRNWGEWGPDSFIFWRQIRRFPEHIIIAAIAEIVEQTGVPFE